MGTVELFVVKDSRGEVVETFEGPDHAQDSLAKVSCGSMELWPVEQVDATPGVYFNRRTPVPVEGWAESWPRF